MREKQFYVYITTNHDRSVLYVGMTNDLCARLVEHYRNAGNKKTFAGRYHCYNLVYYEQTKYVLSVIEREKELKGWTRQKKEKLINTENPDRNFLNETIMVWPPPVDASRCSA